MPAQLVLLENLFPQAPLSLPAHLGLTPSSISKSDSLACCKVIGVRA